MKQLLTRTFACLLAAAAVTTPQLAHAQITTTTTANSATRDQIDVSGKSPIRFNMDATTAADRALVEQDYHTRMVQQNPNYDADRNAYEQQLQTYIANQAALRAQNPNQQPQVAITLPVVVHVVYYNATQNISDNQVLSQIQVLNEDFGRTNADASQTPAAFAAVAANTNIQFCLAQRDPNGNATTGIERRQLTTNVAFSTNDNVKHFATNGLDAWDPTRYLNLWVCNLGSSLLGYGEFPTTSVSQTMGVVILYSAFGSNFTAYGTFPSIAAPYDRGRTTTHEFSHCFNLYHIWGDDGGACTGSDLCADTPNQADATTTCYTFPHTDGCTASGNGIMFMNYMDYSYDNCLNLFTANQSTRMNAVLNSAPYNALQTSNGCTPVVVVANDAGITAIGSPSSVLCSGTFVPSVTLRNYGSASLTQATINYKIDNNTVQTYSWTGTLASNATTNVTLPSMTTTTGTHTFTAYTSNPNGNSDGQPSNDQTTKTFQVLGTGLTLPFTQGFESSPFVPTGWIANDIYNDGNYWARYNAGRNSSWSATFDNYNIDVNGARDEMWTPKLSFASLTTVSMTFDVSYRRYGTGNDDTLQVLVSTDCGVTWNSVYQKGGATLASVTGTQTGTVFVPTNTQWRSETVTLNTYAGQSSVLINFRNRGHYGQAIYVDNINITGASTAPPVAGITASATTVCTGQTLSFTDNSTNSPTSWSWTFPSGTPASATTQNVASVSWSAAGTYTVSHTATNANGSNTATQVITVNATPTVTTTTSGATICSGNSTTITGTGASTYSWMPGSLTGSPVTVSPTTTTTYTVTGTSGAGCTATATRTITVNPSPTVTTTSTNSSICSGSSTSLTANGGTTYSWMPGSLTGGTVTVSPTTTTTYTVTGTTGSCTGTSTIAITVTPTPTVTTTTTNATICSGNSTSITANGGTSYTWMPGSLTGATVTVSPTTTTTYTVTGTTGACSGTSTRTITVNPSPTVTTTTTSATICSGSSTSMTANGATTYAWMPGSLTGGTVTVSPTTTTTYTVTGTSTGCTGTSTRTITVNPTPTVTTTTSGATICSGSSTTITGNGATTYSWMPGSLTGTTVTVSPTTTTTYTVTGTSTGCSGTSTRTITVNPSPTVTTTTSGATICSGNSTTITGNGGSTYSWMPGSLAGTTVTVSPTTTTTYTVTGTAANGCSGTSTRTITVNTSPTVNASASSTSICTGNSVTLSGTGASTYGWMPGSLSGSSVTVTPSSTTTYTLTGTAGNGCTGTSTVAITVGAQPTVSISSTGSTICSGNSATLTGNGATTYTWMPGSLSGTSVTVSPTGTTTYTVTGTVSAGCSNTATLAVTVNATPNVTATISSGTICAGNTTTLTGNGASTYTWMPGSLTGTSVTVTPGSSTTYTVTGTAANGCTNTATQAVTVNALPNVSASASNNTICSGASVALTGTGASTYSWMPGSLSGSSVTVSPGSSTTYSVTGTDANGCTNTSNVSITVNALPTVSASASNNTICAGASVNLTGNGASTYNWMPGNLSGTTVSAVPASSTTYTVTGTDANGCTNTANVAITVNALPSVSASASTNAICIGSSVNLTGSGASNYNWMPGSLSGSSVNDAPTASTTYTVTGTDANGCTNTANVSVTVNALPSVSASASSNAICMGSSVNLTGSGASTYNWMPGNLSGTSVNDAPSASTTYTVTGTDVNGCTNTANVSITVNALPTVSASASSGSVCAGNSVTLTGTGANSYNWMPGNLTGSPVSDTPSASTTYTVTGTDGNGCTNTGNVSITVNALPSVTLSLPMNLVCLDDALLTLTGGSPAGGVYSGTGVSGGTLDPMAAGSGPHTITYTYTDVNGCDGSATQNITVDDCLGAHTGTTTQPISFTVMPNPNNGTFSLAINVNEKDNYVLEVFDVLGQVIHREVLDNFAGSTVKTMDLSAYGAGHYSIRLVSSKNQFVTPVIVR